MQTHLACLDLFLANREKNRALYTAVNQAGSVFWLGLTAKTSRGPPESCVHTQAPGLNVCGGIDAANSFFLPVLLDIWSTHRLFRPIVGLARLTIAFTHCICGVCVCVDIILNARISHQTSHISCFPTITPHTTPRTHHMVSVCYHSLKL